MIRSNRLYEYCNRCKRVGDFGQAAHSTETNTLPKTDSPIEVAKANVCNRRRSGRKSNFLYYKAAPLQPIPKKDPLKIEMLWTLGFGLEM